MELIFGNTFTLKIIIPVRGRKRVKEHCHSKVFLTIKNHNPRKGTETLAIFKTSYYLLWWLLKIIIPVRGRKQFHYGTHLRQYIHIKNHNPRKGTETTSFTAEVEPIKINGIKIIIPVRGRKRISEKSRSSIGNKSLKIIIPVRGRKQVLIDRKLQCCCLHGIKNHNPRKGTETIHVSKLIKIFWSYILKIIIPVRGRKLDISNVVSSSLNIKLKIIIPVRGRKRADLSSRFHTNA